MATIKKSEVERLRKVEADSVPKNAFANAAQYGINQEKLAKQYDSEAGMWCRHTIRFMNQTEDLKNKLWAAEQEIHDLKKIVETEHEDIQKLTNQVIDLLVQAASTPGQIIEVPRYLKPLDALEFQYRQVAY